ncbi:hypothetical protein Tco_0843157 [Tanacetum coccineum]|uniref:Uncharacterized protein n=1 Tax=Tanacetum coccineum TaxID=301880 RepID=A0ABQ5B1U8_9ASTR
MLALPAAAKKQGNKHLLTFRLTPTFLTRTPSLDGGVNSHQTMANKRSLQQGIRQTSGPRSSQYQHSGHMHQLANSNRMALVQHEKKPSGIHIRDLREREETVADQHAHTFLEIESLNKTSFLKFFNFNTSSLQEGRAISE